ncbi:DUF262 domain-containing protein [Paenibacillus thalictri]|uniref:DUF262 domain-containing protein n=1 Tax=Paenibacillus thalictri TaxID=2527873 RepID=A0A4Q9DXA1_9BACL|nr:DUF262 domain-containing protein [Paenibacillus thalictri]TBL81729.1 DUF262 domain-containing protein [Paenibacillus thalictri]
MAFEKPITIKEAVENMAARQFLLPSIQREFVWKPEQMEKLFDSLMKEYPVGSFLFWSVQGDNVHNYQFYEFIRDFHEKDNKRNPKATTSGMHSLTAILDGQQRLTSLYIGLKGSYTEKLPYKRVNDPNAYDKKKLYLNLKMPSDRIDFRFLSDKEVVSYPKGEYFWYRVGDILNCNGMPDIFKFITVNNITENFASECLMMLFQQVIMSPVIHFFMEKGNELDKVLNIFIRVNSGGTQLTYSDLLLSIATAQWENEDARDRITELVDEINDYGDGFNFDKDTVLKSCLVLCDFTDISFKVDNFNAANMKKIEDEWDTISQSIRVAVKLLASFGYNAKTLTANSVIIPVAYYIYRIGNPINFDVASKHQDDRNQIKKFVIVSLLKRIFGGQPDNVLRPMREIIKGMTDKFSFDAIKSNLKITNKSLRIDDEDINALLYTKYGSNYAFSLLALLYPTLDYRNIFHQDHIIPRSLLKSQTKLRKLGLTNDQINFCLENVDYIGNLQLLEGVPNIEKSDMPTQQWLDQTYPTAQEQADFRHKHYIPSVELSASKFEEFMKQREVLIANKLEQILI